jgi:hypothetical protein
MSRRNFLSSGCTRLLHRGKLAAASAALLALAFAVVILSPSPAYADEEYPGRVGRVAEFAGELYIAPQDQPDLWTPIGLNYPIATGDNLWVTNEGRAEIDFGGGQFRLASETSIHVSRLEDRDLALYVAQGGAILRIRVLDPGDTARIDTPNAQLVITRSGLYRVDVSEDGQHTQLIVREGEADVYAGGMAQQVLPGQSAAMDGVDPQGAQVRNGIGMDGFDTWSSNRDRRYERGRTTSYVSRQMVGYADLEEYGTWESAPEYGAVWYPTAVAADWAPYRDGYWTDVGAWGPTWVDSAPWGYAPFHYGRWAIVRGRWGWCPGAYVVRPVWAPALVGWAGGPGWGFASVQGGAVYGWVPLGWGEAYQPAWGRCSRGCWERYNRPYAVNLTERTGTPPAHYANWNVPGAVTAVPGAVLQARKPVQGNQVSVPGHLLSSAPVLANAPQMHFDVGRVPGRKPGIASPIPASATYDGDRQRRAADAHGTMGASAPSGVSMVRVPPANRPPPSTSLPAPAAAPNPPTNTPTNMTRITPAVNNYSAPVNRPAPSPPPATVQGAPVNVRPPPPRERVAVPGAYVPAQPAVPLSARPASVAPAIVVPPGSPQATNPAGHPLVGEKPGTAAAPSPPGTVPAK